MNKKNNGRPALYNKKLRDEICSRLADGESLRSICRDSHIPHRDTINRWIIENRGEVVKDGVVVEQGFYDHYSRAKDVCLDNMADEILEISDDGTNDYVKKLSEKGNEFVIVDHEHVNRSRLRVESRKWYLSKLAPKRYGSENTIKHQQLDKSGNNIDPVSSIDINIHSKEIADAVEKEMSRILGEYEDEKSD